MAYNGDIINKARVLRKSGHSIKRIAVVLQISPDTASRWVRDVPLSSAVIKTLQRNSDAGRQKALQVIAQRRKQNELEINNRATQCISRVQFNEEYLKIMCSLLFWGEGNKTGSRVGFINSDPQMISTFMSLLRRSFPLDESKFRALVHIHEYHNENEIKKYWSVITKIPISQFTKSYLKPHTSKVIRPGYKGTIRISYYNSQIAAQLKATYNALARHIGAW